MATKLIVMTGFLIAFAAGIVTGMQGLTARPQEVRIIPPTAATTTRQTRPPGYFIEQLKLTPEQTQKWNKIWSELADRGGRGQQDRVGQLRQSRELKILALIPESSRGTYDQIQKEFTDGVDQIDKDFRDSYDDAVRKTKEILSDKQRTDYEAILKRNQWDRGRGGRGSRGGGGPGGPGGRQGRSGQNPSSDSRDEKTRQPGASATSQPDSVKLPR